MNEIAGKYHFDGAFVAPEQVKRMLDAVSSWPADREGICHETTVGLGARQFFTTKEDLEDFLPLKVGPYILIADARIDNRRQLFRELSLGLNDVDSSITDSHLILKAYEKWGEDCPNHLIGDFAFAIWDARTHRWFCARDAMGVRPFYYCHIPGKLFAFGTTIGMVLQGCDNVDTGLNELKLGLIMALDYSDRQITIRKNIFRLPGGHCLSVGLGQFVIRQYWKLEELKEIRLGSDEEYAANLRDVFFEAVHCRLRSIHPIGAHLSGGLDSSSVVCTAARLMSTEISNDHPCLHTFSAIFPRIAESNKAIDERRYQQAVVEHCANLLHHPIVCDDLDPLHEVLWSSEEPFIAYNLFLDSAMCNAAKGLGVRVILTGIDGDSVISHGYEYLPALVSQGRWVEFCRQCYGVSHLFGISLLSVIWNFGLKHYCEKLMSAKSVLFSKEDESARSLALINRDFAQQINLWDVLHDNAKTRNNSGNLTNTQTSYIASIYHGMWSQLLELYDRFSRKDRIESRHPFFDRRVIEYCYSIPLSQKLCNGVSRYVFHNAMRGIIPDVVNSRLRKANLSSGFHKGLAQNLKPWTEFESYDCDQLYRYVDKSYYQMAANRILYNANKADDDLNTFCAIVIKQWLAKGYLHP